MEQQKARSQQRNGLGIEPVGRLAHILEAHSFFAKKFFFLLKLPPPARRELLVAKAISGNTQISTHLSLGGDDSVKQLEEVTLSSRGEHFSKKNCSTPS